MEKSLEISDLRSASPCHSLFLILRKHCISNWYVLLCLGTQADIDSALEMIRQKFPAKRYPSVTLEQVSFLPPVPTFPVVPEFLQLHLVEGVNNDVILSSLVSTAHFFLQQPTHPTFPALNRLNGCMNVCYSEPTAPLLPMPTQGNHFSTLILFVFITYLFNSYKLMLLQ